MKTAWFAVLMSGMAMAEDKPDPQAERLKVVIAQRDSANAQIALANAIFSQQDAKTKSDAAQKAAQDQADKSCKLVPDIPECPKPKETAQ